MNSLNFLIASLGIAAIAMVAVPVTSPRKDAKADTGGNRRIAVPASKSGPSNANLRNTMLRQQATLKSQQRRVKILDAELRQAVKEMKKRQAKESPKR